MPTPMIDTHCHLDVPAFAEDVDAVIARATAAGVVGMLVPAIRPAMWPALPALVARHRGAGLRLAIGVHPQIVPELAPGEIERDIDGVRDGEHDRDIDAIAAWIARNAAAHGAIAIGECGLDGATGDLPRQVALFRAHVRAARITSLPLVVHVLRAHDLAPRILREELARARVRAAEELARARVSAGEELARARVRAGEELARARVRAGEELARARAMTGEELALVDTPAVESVVGVMHSYSGGAELVETYRELGFAFSFAGPVSYANARKPVEAARVVPEDLLLAETDAPDQAPEGHRGGRSEPAFVAAVIAGLAAARGQTAEDVAARTTANARRIFRSWE